MDPAVLFSLLAITCPFDFEMKDELDVAVFSVSSLLTYEDIR